MRLGFVCILVLAGMLGFQCRAWADESVTVVLSEDGGVYGEFAVQLGSILGQHSSAKVALRVVPLSNLKDEPPARSGQNPLVVAVGTPAMTAMARRPLTVPVLNVLVPRASFRSVARSSPRTQDSKLFSAVFFDQPWARQLALIRHAAPGRRVGSPSRPGGRAGPKAPRRAGDPRLRRAPTGRTGRWTESSTAYVVSSGMRNRPASRPWFDKLRDFTRTPLRLPWNDANNSSPGLPPNFPAAPSKSLPPAPTPASGATSGLHLLTIRCR